MSSDDDVLLLNTPNIYYHGFPRDVYYKIKRMNNGLVTIVCLQCFDEDDYDQNTFIKNTNGQTHIFDTKERAVKKMVKWFKPNEIDERYLQYVDNVRD